MNENENENNTVRVPIKTMLEISMKENNAEYGELEMNLLRRYFIGGLNTGFFEVDRLEAIVNKLTSKLKKVIINANNRDVLPIIDRETFIKWIKIGIITKENTLYMSSSFKIRSNFSGSKFSIAFFRTITEIITDTETAVKHPSAAAAVCQMVADDIYKREMLGISSKELKYTEEELNGHTLKYADIFSENCMLCVLFYQLVLCNNKSVSKTISGIFSQGYEKAMEDRFSSDINERALELLDRIHKNYAEDILCFDSAEQYELIKQYECYLIENFIVSFRCREYNSAFVLKLATIK